MNKITIAIDGFSSTGKSTLAKQLAKQLGYVYVDTGAMYRAVTLYAMHQRFIAGKDIDKAALVQDLASVQLKFVYNNELGFGEMFLNGANVEKEIRSLEVSQWVSAVAEISQVRSKLVEQQQKMGISKGIVMDGRDIGTVVFPNAELKIFMTASPETRAKRRYDEMVQKGEHVTFEEILQNVQQRDHIDTHREDSPLRKAADAIEIDNSNLSREEQLRMVLALVDKI